jgi:hypothetical protein
LQLARFLRYIAAFLIFCCHSFESSTMAGTVAAAACCPRRCFLVDIATTLSSNSSNYNHYSNTKEASSGITLLRLMGTVVSIVQESLNGAPTIHLDDGTGLAAIITSLTMLEAIHCCIGTSLDCIVRVDYSDSGHSINSNNSNNVKNAKLHADSLMIVPDAHAETLRWLELSYLKKNPGNFLQQQDQSSRQQQSQSSQSQLLYMQSRTGYPCHSVQADDVYQLIQSDGSDAYVYQGQKGLLAKDLAIVLDISIDHVHDLIQELQIEGLVYQNQEGGYMPL